MLSILGVQGLREFSSVASSRVVPVFLSRSQKYWQVFDRMPRAENLDLAGWKGRVAKVKIDDHVTVEAVVFVAKGGKHGFVPIEALQKKL
jgi:hypothetical protein